jgi:hypothetical protein
MTALGAYRAVRIGSAIVLAGTAVRHAMLAASGASVGRHAIFIVINLALATLLVWRPRWAFYPTLALTVQQLYSHGLDLSQSFLGTAPLDKASLAVCLFFPTLVTLLYMERQEEEAPAS